MHPFFDSLNERESMCLLTTLTVGGNSQVSLFRYLPTISRQRLQGKAEALGRIDRDKRVSFMVQQLKRALSTPTLESLQDIHPSWLAFELQSESPQMIAALMAMCPDKVTSSIISEIEAHNQVAIPNHLALSEELRKRLDATSLIFRQRFAPMPKRQPSKTIGFTDLVFLETNDLERLIESLGLVEMGQAFAAVGKVALAEFCRRLPKQQSEALISTVKRTAQLDEATLQSARRFLSRIAVDFSNSDQFFELAGLWRLSKSSQLLDSATQMALSQRLPRIKGLQYRDFLNRAKEMDDLSNDMIERLEDSVLKDLQRLSQSGMINATWGQKELRFNN